MAVFGDVVGRVDYVDGFVGGYDDVVVVLDPVRCVVWVEYVVVV